MARRSTNSSKSSSASQAPKQAPAGDAVDATGATQDAASTGTVSTDPLADKLSPENEVATVVEEVAKPSEAPSVDDVVASDADDDFDSEDSLTFSNGVIEKIVAIAMRDVPGVVGMKGGWINRMQETFGARDPRKGVTVEVTPESAVRVNISILIEYGAYAPQVFEDVKQAVVNQVTGMTGLTVAGVNLRIEDVLTAEEVAARRAARGLDVQREVEVESGSSTEAGRDERPSLPAIPADASGEV